MRKIVIPIVICIIIWVLCILGGKACEKMGKSREKKLAEQVCVGVLKEVDCSSVSDNFLESSAPKCFVLFEDGRKVFSQNVLLGVEFKIGVENKIFYEDGNVYKVIFAKE